MRDCGYKCAEGVIQVRVRPGEHNEVDDKDCEFEANDLAFERNTPSTAFGLELMMVAAVLPAVAKSNKRLHLFGA